jgi:hypothetical protein
MIASAGFDSCKLNEPGQVGNPMKIASAYIKFIFLSISIVRIWMIFVKLNAL